LNIYEDFLTRNLNKFLLLMTAT